MTDTIEISATLTCWPTKADAQSLIGIIQSAEPAFKATQELIKATWAMKRRGELIIENADAEFCEERGRIVWSLDAGAEVSADYWEALDLQSDMDSIIDCYLGDLGAHVGLVWGGLMDTKTKCGSLNGFERERA